MLLAKAAAQLFWLANVNHEITVVPTVDVIATGLLLANPLPVMTRDEATVADVAAVSTPLVIVERAKVGPAACALCSGSRKTIPAIPARNNSPIVPKEASLLFVGICVCIYFTLFS
jgi:hypothetical protein